jgi:hypothetical protein
MYPIRRPAITDPNMYAPMIRGRKKARIARALSKDRYRLFVIRMSTMGRYAGQFIVFL